MKLYFRLFNYLQPLGLKAPLYLVAILLYTIFSMANFALLIPLLNILFENTEPSTEVIKEVDPTKVIEYIKYSFNVYLNEVIETHGQRSALKAVCIILVISVILKNVFSYLAAIIRAKFRVNFIYKIRKEFFKRVLTLHLGYFTDTRRGDLLTKGTHDINQVQGTIVDSLASFIREPLSIIFSFIILFHISAELTVYTLLILPASGIIIGTISKRLRSSAAKTFSSLADIGSIVNEALSGIRVIKAFTAEKFMMNKLGVELAAYSRHVMKFSKKAEITSPVSELLGVTAVAGVLFIGGMMILDKSSSLEAAEFISFIALFSQLLNPAKALSKAVTGLQQGLAAGESVFQVLDTKAEIIDKPTAKDLTSFDQGIKFDNVSFSYANENVLQGISFDVLKGETVALVGTSGGGKSTIADLLPRFYDVKDGTISVDGVDIREYSLESYRKLFGIVTQESILFNDTIYNNIAFGLNNVTDEEVIAAAKIANAHEFIMKLDNKYQANIGEAGGKLSGGQKQRLSIARAVLKDPKILILDEATSALDSESEQLVQEALKKIMANRTSLVIAHRLSTIQHADKILVVQDGQIIEKGTHQQLIANEGLYKKLTQIQTI